jgi:hypothetical protein
VIAPPWVAVARKAFALVPDWVWVVLFLGALLLSLRWHWIGVGEDRERARVAEATTKLVKRAVKDQVKVSERVVTVYVDRVEKVRGRTEYITKEVPVYVPADACPLPAGFRLLHDAAATGNPLPGPAAVAHAAPVPAQTAAAVVVGNYGSCHETAARLTALQEWVREQERLNPSAP